MFRLLLIIATNCVRNLVFNVAMRNYLDGVKVSGCVRETSVMCTLIA